MWILSCILILVVPEPGLSLPTPADDIPVPHLRLLRTFDYGFTILWDPIDTTNVKDPIIGIKVITWKTPCVIKTYYRLSNNGSSLVVESAHEDYNSTTVPDILPEYVTIVMPDELSATVHNIERAQWYHVRALAFTTTAEGKPSNSYEFQLGSDDEKEKEKSCERVISETPCEHNGLINLQSPDSC
ncbi:uncharacterized protein LOC112050985 [Bicyclus anynana]|uniref:Uncharacterized protein LOC112050985 n=1 Tax=Bicyclus anynana TaxID=110368 RepID=A0A6J1NE47_BICAN|nr:uncharacterized protein LOC112050985 [Bicyclus anynana]